MIALAAAALRLRRRVGAADALALGALAVLAFDPLAPLAVGFWLSFVAVAVILFVGTGHVREPGILAGFTRVQMAVTIGLVPVLAGAFGSVSLVSAVVNAAAIPLYTLVIVPAILIGTAVTLVAPAAGAAVLGVVASLIEFTWPLIEAPAGWLHATWGIASLPVAGWIALVAGAVAALAPLPAPGRVAGVIMVVALGGLAGAAARTGRGPPRAAGCGAGACSRGADASSRAGVRHRPGLPQRYRHGPARRRAIPAQSGRTHGRHAGCQSRRRRSRRGSRVGCAAAARAGAGGKRSRARSARARPALSGRAALDLGRSALRLAASVRAAAARRQRSLVRARDTRGTASHRPDGRRREARRAAHCSSAGLSGPADILVVPHHGSRTSSSAGFVAATRPRWAVVSAGHRNRWGFPAPAIVERWRDSRGGSAAHVELGRHRIRRHSRPATRSTLAMAARARAHLDGSLGKRWAGPHCERSIQCLSPSLERQTRAL